MAFKKTTAPRVKAQPPAKAPAKAAKGPLPTKAPAPPSSAKAPAKAAKGPLPTKAPAPPSSAKAPAKAAKGPLPTKAPAPPSSARAPVKAPPAPEKLTKTVPRKPPLKIIGENPDAKPEKVRRVRTSPVLDPAQFPGLKTSTSPGDVRKHVMELATTSKNANAELSMYLYGIRKKKLYRAWGFESFADYCSQELEYQVRVAIYLSDIYEQLVLGAKQPPALIEAHGYGKLAPLASAYKQEIITEEKLNSLIKVLPKYGVKEWEAKIKALRDKARSSGGPETPDKILRVSAVLTNTQVDSWNTAREIISKQLADDKPSNVKIVDLLLNSFGSGSTSEALSLESALVNLGRVFPGVYFMAIEGEKSISICDEFATELKKRTMPGMGKKDKIHTLLGVVEEVEEEEAEEDTAEDVAEAEASVDEEEAEEEAGEEAEVEDSDEEEEGEEDEEEEAEDSEEEEAEDSEEEEAEEGDEDLEDFVEDEEEDAETE